MVEKLRYLLSVLLAHLGLFALLFAFSQQTRADELLHFPVGFQWCVATSAHQVEGNNTHSDWWQWEQKAGKIAGGQRSGLACDEWNRVDEDVKLMEDLGVGTYRFSVEWAKIEPSEGNFDSEALGHYLQEIKTLRAHGIIPLVTLHHFTNPAWFQNMGGWESSRAPELFERYVKKVVSVIGPVTANWITFNEPLVFLPAGYVTGEFPPGKKGALTNLKIPVLNMLRAHARAYHLIHRMARQGNRAARVGFAHHIRVFDPWSYFNPADVLVTSVVDAAYNWAIPTAVQTGRVQISIPGQLEVDEEIDGLAGTQDFFGLNYYSRDRMKFSLDPIELQKRYVTPDAPVNDLGWEIYPQGLHRILTNIHHRYPKLPIMITENGIADATDAKRPDFIRSHLTQIHEAIEAGVPVIGYCEWSLLDNFEWDNGFTPRFGLYEMDYATQTRTPRPSAKLYSQIIHQNAVERLEEFPQ